MISVQVDSDDIFNWPDDIIKFGDAEGDTCNRSGCDGLIEFTEPENCSCHISPPCAACTSVFLFCPKCDWEDNQ